MWPYGRGRGVPHVAQNLTVYNPGGYSQNPIYSTYMPYAPNPPYLQQEPIGYMTYPPYPQYSQQEIGYTTYAPYPVYSQQEIGARLSQDPMANDMILRDRNWPFQNHYKRETMPEYRNGEVVMVRCNQHKWLPGVIQRMSAQGVRIWITDANILVNVPLILLPTHVVKMSVYSEFGTLPQIEPVWTTTDNGGYRKVLVQCVPPTHPSHRELFHALEYNICAICKNLLSNMIDVVSPWNCRHQVHNYCLQFQMQQSSTATCPCNDNASRERMHLASSSNAFASPSNGQQRWFDLQCPCGFRTTIVGVGNMEAPVFCPNCQQRVNINPMQSGPSINVNPTTLSMQSGEPRRSLILNPKTIRMQSASTNVPHAYSEPERELPQSLNSSEASQSLDSLDGSHNFESPESFERERFFSAQDFGSGWPTQSFSGPSRLEAIEEGREGSEPNSSLEPHALDKSPSYLPSYLEALRETFENNNISDNNVIAMRPVDQNIQPPSGSRSTWHDGPYYEPFHNQSTIIQNNQYSSSRNSLQDDILYEPSRKPTLIQNKQYLNSESLLQDGSLEAASPSSPTLMKIEQSISHSSLQRGSIGAPSIAPTSLIQNEQLRENALSPLAAPTLPSRVNFAEVEEANEAMENLWKRASEPITSIVPIEGPKIWKRASPGEPNTSIAVTKVLKGVSDLNTTIAAPEGPKLFTIANEANETIAATEDQRLWKRTSEPDTSIVAIEGPKIWKRASEPNTTIAVPEVQTLLKRASEPNAVIEVPGVQKLVKMASEPNAISERQEVLKKVNESTEARKRASEPSSIAAVPEVQKVLKEANEPNQTIAVPEVQKLLKGVSEPNTIEDRKLSKTPSEPNATIVVHEVHKLLHVASDTNTTIAAAIDQKVWKRASEPNTTLAIIEGQKALKRASEPNTTLAVIEGPKALKRASEPDTTHASTNDQRLWKRASKAIAAPEGQRLWRRASEVNWTDEAESGDTERASSSNDFAASSSSAAPVYMNHFDEGQKSWRRPSAVDWTEEHEESDETITPSTAPTYINHFADFVKLAMAGSSTAKDIIASASSPAPSSPSTSNPESGASVWVTPPPAFFTRASALFTEAAPAWVTLSKDRDQADWITVIKDGIDSRKDEKRGELERMARAKDSEFL